MADDAAPEAIPSSIRVISLNCWGLKYISKHRRERLQEIGHRLATADPPPQIVGLQECWTQEDYLAIRDQTSHILPFGKFYHSGFFGSGLVILSAWPIEESSMYSYPLNGRPAAFFRGDWYVGKGVACARIRLGRKPEDVVEVFCTHLHAPYEPEDRDSYACHRTAQAWEIAKLMRHAAERGHMVIGLGDFNMLPTSLAHQIVEAHSPVKDVWSLIHGLQIEGSADAVRSVEDSVEIYGTTCDSALNTWRWSKSTRKDLARGNDPTVDLDSPDPAAKRLDYVFFHPPSSKDNYWKPTAARVGMIERHPRLRVSLSDHFSVEVTLTARSLQPEVEDRLLGMLPDTSMTSLDAQTYTQILDMIEQYMQRERRQGRLQVIYFVLSVWVAIACLGSIWDTERIWLAFVLAVISTLALSSGVIAGLIGGLFVKQEVRALREFHWEVQQAKSLVLTANK